MKNNLSIIKNLIVDYFNIYNVKYILSGLICCPTAGHYNSILLNVITDMHFLKRDKIYFYDDLNSNIIFYNKDWRYLLKSNFHFIFIYRIVRIINE